MSNQARSLSSWRLRSLSASTLESPIRKNPLVTFTAKPDRGTPRVCSACFIRMPGTFEMPPAEKSAGSLKTISTVWLAGRVLSTLRRSDQVMASLRSGTSTVGTDRQLGRLSRAGRDGFGAPHGRSDGALAVGIGGILLVEHNLLPDVGACLYRRCESRARLAAGLDAIGDIRTRD